MTLLILAAVALLAWPRIRAWGEGISAARAALTGIIDRTTAMQTRARTRARWQIAGLALVALIAKGML